ncbi:hypothetical protein CH352_16410 [Leptospira hartskeerlii]|uniref:Lipoprotein n=1 Tax=Leptospira hartskeerlii TaxID=2023177 RepID=A0A2M9X9P1_9LEPT|nr:hypothetical protein [Leptospira hartskeerlii]PJZ24339.1 hypothetical protein CH357_16905 [Leptospira hartskeerlii]PJZ32525.1 hypothetical protein CH352_16410 [Leptospira hartskeerlii]
MKSLNKKVSKAVSALAVAIALVGCDSGGGSNGAGLALAALGGAGYEATVIINGKLTQSGTFAKANCVGQFPANFNSAPAFAKPLYVKLTSSKITAGGTDFTVACANASGNNDAADFNITTKISDSSATIKGEVFSVPDTTTCSGNPNPCDSSSNYTELVGTFDMAVNVDLSAPTSASQITFSNETGVVDPDVAASSAGLVITGTFDGSTLASNISVITSVKGVYSNPNATVGEAKCDSIGNPEIVSGNITSNKTLGAYTLLRGTVTVSNGATITAPAGAVIYGERGSAMFFNGGNLVTNGTAANPVCFTSAQARGSRFPGDWGGLIFIGSGNNTRTAAALTEGTNPLAYPLSSGSSSVTLNYTIVEFAGTEVAPGDELNSYSMYALNSGNFNYVQSHRGLDDSFEWWGGGRGANATDVGTAASPNLTGTGGATERTFKGKFLLGTGGMDDDFDMDEGFSGALKYIIAVKYPKTCGGTPSTDPGGMEMDGVDGTTKTPSATAGDEPSNPFVDQYTLLGVNETASYAERHREGMKGLFLHGVAYAFKQIIKCESAATSGTGYGDSTSIIDGLVSDTNPDQVQTCTLTTSTGTRDTSLASAPVASITTTQSNCGFLGFKPDLKTNVAGKTTWGGAPDTGTTLYDFDGTTVVTPTGGNSWYSGWSVWRAR